VLTEVAIMRCQEHPPKRTTRRYAGAVEPIGYPETAVVCGSAHCRAAALIWLEQHEMAEFMNGERVFKAFTPSMKVRAK
jgi:hypothetical protein